MSAIAKKPSRGRHRTKSNTHSPGTGSQHETTFSELQHKLADDLSSEGSAERERKKGGILSMITSKVSRTTRKRDKPKPIPMPPPDHVRPDSTFDLTYTPGSKKRPAGFKEPIVANPLLEKHEKQRRDTLDDLEETELDVLNDVSTALGGQKFQPKRGRGVVPSVLESKKLLPMKNGQDRAQVLPSIIMDQNFKPRDRKELPSIIQERSLKPKGKREMPSIIQEESIGSRMMPSILVEASSEEIKRTPAANKNAISDTPKSGRRKRRKKRKKGATKQRDNDDIANYV